MSLKDYVKRGSFLAHSRYIIPHLATCLVCYTGGTLNGNQFFHCLVQFLQFPYSLSYTCVLIATIVSIPSNLPLFPRLGQPIVTVLTRIGPFVIVNIYWYTLAILQNLQKKKPYCKGRFTSHIIYTLSLANNCLEPNNCVQGIPYAIKRQVSKLIYNPKINGQKSQYPNWSALLGHGTFQNVLLTFRTWLLY